MSPVRLVLCLTAVALPVASAGCSSPKPAPMSGFLGDYSGLEKTGPASMGFSAPDERLAAFSRFVVDPVEVRVTPPEGSSITKDELEQLAEYLRAAVVRELSQSYEVVPEAQAGAARIRAAITDVQPGTGWLNIHPATRFSGAGAGSAAFECEVTDAQSGERLAAWVERRSGPRVGFDGVSRFGDARAVIDGWARRIRRRLDEARERAEGVPESP
jgi:hypothetical protein